MKTGIQSVLLALTLLATPALAGAGTTPSRARALTPAESARLRSFEEPRLGELRAGVVTAATPIPADERGALSAAEARNSDLQALRAGDLNLTDHDLMIIGIVLGVVIIILLI